MIEATEIDENTEMVLSEIQDMRNRAILNARIMSRQDKDLLDWIEIGKGRIEEVCGKRPNVLSIRISNKNDEAAILVSFGIIPLPYDMIVGFNYAYIDSGKYINHDHIVNMHIGDGEMMKFTACFFAKLPDDVTDLLTDMGVMVTEKTSYNETRIICSIGN